MTGTDLPIELARRADAGAIARGSRDMIEHGLAWSWTPARVTASIRSHAALVVVTRAPDGIAGFAIMRYGDDEAHLDLLGVAPAYRGAGLGRGLVEWLEKPALVGGIATVVLELRASNHDARAFYERLGYHAVGRSAGYYQGRESALRMRRALGTRESFQPFVWTVPTGSPLGEPNPVSSIAVPERNPTLRPRRLR